MSPAIRVEVPNRLRYTILGALDPENKVRQSVIEKRVKNLTGPPQYIVPKGDLPVGTVSQIVEYVLVVNGWKLIRAHQYLLPDGSIRGGPDPKYIRLDDIIIVPEPRRGK